MKEEDMQTGPAQVERREECRLRLRAVEPEDAQFMYEVENDVDSWIYGDTVAPLSYEQLSTYAMTYTADPSTDGQLRLILEMRSEDGRKNCEEDVDTGIMENIHHGEAIGIVDLYGINQRHGHCFIGIYIKPTLRQMGHGREGVAQMAALARRFLNLDRICAKVVDINRRSLQFFRGCGFKECGVLSGWLKIDGERRDLHLLELDLRKKIPFGQ